MNVWGFIIMTVSCGFVIALNVFCFYRVFRRKGK